MIVRRGSWLSLLLLIGVMILGHPAMDAAADASEPQCPQKRKTAKAPNDIYMKLNPVPPTGQNIKEGEVIFKERARPLACKLCHGDRGTGLGDPDFESTPPARNFTCTETMHQISDGQMFWVIKNGVKDTSMPAFEDLSDEDIWKVIHYIRQFSSRQTQ